MVEETNRVHIEVILPTKYVLTFNYYKTSKVKKTKEKVTATNCNLWGQTCNDLLNLVLSRCVTKPTYLLGLTVSNCHLIDDDFDSDLFYQLFLCPKQKLSKYVSKYSKSQVLSLSLQFKIYVEHMVELTDKTLILFSYNQIKDNLRKLPEFGTVPLERVLHLVSYIYGLENIHSNNRSTIDTVKVAYTKMVQFLPSWIQKKSLKSYVVQSVQNLQEGIDFSK